MFISFLRAPIAALAVLAAMSLPAGAAGSLKDIRKVTVVADGTVSPAVAKLTVQHLKQAVRATRRPVQLPKVTMDVQLSNSVRGVGSEAGRNSALVTVFLRDASGSAVSSEKFTVNSFMPGVKAGDRALAKAISQRVAHSYQLAHIRVASASQNKSVKRYSKRRSAPVAAEVASKPTKVEDPVIIPSQAALTVRPRVRKLKVEANAAAKPAPCVVTETTNCN